MNTFDTKNDLWKAFPAWGCAFAILMSLIDYAHDNYAIVILFLSFFLFSGFTQNMVILGRFVRHYFIFSVAIIIWIIYFYLHPTEPTSFRMPIFVFCIVYSGYRLSIDGSESIKLALQKLIMLISTTTFIAIVWYFNGVSGVANYFATASAYFESYYDRLSGLYMQPMPAATIILVFTLLSIYITENKLPKILATLFGLYALWLTSTRGAILICLIGLTLYFIRECKISKSQFNYALSSIDKVIISVFSVIVIGIIFLKRSVIVHTLLGTTLQRFAIFNATTDRGNAYRLVAWNETMVGFFQNSILEKFIGKGVLSAFYNRPIIRDFFYEWTPAGPVENTFLSILYDFGIIGFIFILLSGILAIICFIKCTDYINRCCALVLLTLLAESLTYDMEYWNNVSFLLFYMMGIILGITELFYNSNNKKKQKFVHIYSIPGLIFCWIPKMLGMNIICDTDSALNKLKNRGLIADILSSVLLKMIIIHTDNAESNLTDKNRGT